MGGGGVVGKAENIATQPNLAGAWAELGNINDQKEKSIRRQRIFLCEINLSK